MKLSARYVELEGTSYEIGYKNGAMLKGSNIFKNEASKREVLDDVLLKEAIELLDKYCDGINEEIKGFADGIEMPYERVIYYFNTYLVPRCSQIAISPKITANNHTIFARNYEFSHMLDDFTLSKTSVKGKYTHIGTSVIQFGRDEGINEHGLIVSMSSCGFPVGANENMRAPKLKGLQFWAVIRSLLENCRDVSEAIKNVKEMPIAYNINLMLADKNGNMALVETLDGAMEIKEIDKEKENYLHATNHPHLESIIKIEPMAMSNSIKRYDYIKKYLDNNKDIKPEDLKTLLLSKYPEGLCCHYYNEFFGTTKSIVMDANEGYIEICFGGDVKNGWDRFYVNEKIENKLKDIELTFEISNKEMYKMVNI